MTSLHNPIIDDLFPSFITGAKHFHNTLKRRTFTYAQGPATPSADWALMFEHWEPIQYLLGGTLAMRAARTKYLPQHIGEPDDIYEARLLRSVLYGAYSRTVNTLASLPFLTATQVKNLPKPLEYLIQHANGDDDSLEVLGKQLTMDLINFGKCHVLVDYPVNPGGLTLAQEKEMNMRPYFNRIDPLKAIGWTYETIGSKRELTSFRLFEDVVEQDPQNEWQEILSQVVRVIKKDSIEIYKSHGDRAGTSSGDDYELVEILPNTLGKVNVVTIYANKTGYQTSRPMLEELAHLNIRHWNKLSDLDNIEHVANVPFAYATGVPEDQMSSLTISPHGLLTIPDADVKLAYLEHSGAAIGASQKSIEALERRMVAMGADTLAARPTSTRETAASKTMDNTKSNSVLQSAVVNLEKGLVECFKMAGEWLDIKVGDDLQANIGDKMTLSADANVITSLLELAKTGSMSFEDLTLELQRRGTISESTELKEAPKPEPVLPVKEGEEDDVPEEQDQERQEQTEA